MKVLFATKILHIKILPMSSGILNLNSKKWIISLATMNFIKLLQSRFLLKDMISTSESYTNRSIYCGFDPTASSLHLGHLCALNSLAYASSLSLKPIAILGTATALIGDPSGKTESRPLIDKETISNNTLSLSSQIHKVFSNLQKKINSPCADLRVIENGTFYTNLDLIKFLREVGYYFPVNPLINRDFVQKRADGVTYTEFSYGLLQAYDFLTLFEKYDCVGQIGGSDQWSNITSGTELIRKKLGKHSFGCTLPLLTTRDGKKFGKTEGNALFFDKSKTKSYDIYQYCYNLPDDEIEKLLYRLTFVSAEKIIETLKLPLETRSGQKLLAYEIISTLHGDQEAKNTQRISEILFKEDYNNVNNI